ncbi:hypothetical protein CRYUN_Cryun02cG0133000 [Craigia yunnanensis]
MVELTTDRGLVLSDPNDKEILRSDFATGEVAYARMNDTGNFVVYSAGSQQLWESFENLTDTLLPTQKFTDNNENWTVIKPFPDDICWTPAGDRETGICGFNSICILNADKRPTCECPQNYSLSVPNDEYGNCQADFMQGCDADAQSSDKDLYDIVELKDTNWPYGDYELIEPCSSKIACKTYCLQDCLCAAAVFNGNQCWMKALPLRNGRKAVNATETPSETVSLLKVRKPEFALKNPQMPFSCTKKNHNSLIILVSMLLGSSVFANFVWVGMSCMGSFFLYHKKIIRNHINKNGIQSSLRYFDYKELEEATDGFKDELGSGSFGIVYKGVIKTNSQDPIGVAVKKLDRVVQDRDKEFRTEVSVIAQKHHKNLVKLLGYCDKGQYRMLVYEYLSNGTLASFLFGDLKPRWSQRTQIALGIARGLFYLHEECSPQIIHCDIKPQNILLDDYYEAWISDFGLSKLLGISQSYTNTAIRGTKGYIAPDWFKPLPVTVKVDAYSFGVILLEIICCRRNVAINNGAVEEAILTDWACDCVLEGNLDALVDNDAEALSDKMKLERFVMVAIWCIREDFSLRSTIKKVILMLEGIIPVPAPPCPCPQINSIN